MSYDDVNGFRAVPETPDQAQRKKATPMRRIGFILAVLVIVATLFVAAFSLLGWAVEPSGSFGLSF